MPDLILDDVDDALVALLAMRAAANGRSVEDEHRAILEQAFPPSNADLIARLRAMQMELAGRITDDSADLIRADRDSR